MLTVALWFGDRGLASPFASVARSVEFSNETDLRDLLRAHRADAVVLRTGADCTRAVGIVLRTLKGAEVRQCPIVADVPRDALAYDQIKELLHAGCDVRIALRGYVEDPVAEEIRQIATANQSASEFLLTELGEAISWDAAPILIPAIVIGGKKTSVSSLCAASPFTSRSLRDRLRMQGLPTPLVILGLVAGFHIAYNACVLGMSLRQAAQWAQFETEDEMRNYVKRRTTIIPRQWRKLGLFGALQTVREHLMPRSSAVMRQK